jgi:hypothetical protein
VTIDSFAVAPATVPVLTPSQRIALRDLLDQLWRDKVLDITNLAVRFHSDEDPDVAARLVGVRRRLVDIEAALARLDSGSYGLCDACDRRMPFEQLEADPETRYCRRCRA